MSRPRLRISMALDGLVDDFDDVGDDMHGLQLVRTVATPNVSHLRYARR